MRLFRSVFSCCAVAPLAVVALTSTPHARQARHRRLVPLVESISGHGQLLARTTGNATDPTINKRAGSSYPGIKRGIAYNNARAVDPFVDSGKIGWG